MQSIILSRRDFKENDQIISLYTFEHGKVEALARGVKKILSKNSAALEPFCFVEAEIIPGKKDLAYLGSVTPINIFKNIRADLAKSLMAGYVVKLLDKLIHPNEPDKRIFELLKSWLAWSDIRGCHPERSEGSTSAVEAFVAKLLYILGFSADNIFVKKSWEEIAKMSFDKKVHDKIYHDLVFNTEVKIKDWA
ncbi:MAG: DNA repair protein RecO [Candidatus Magasanikbacteria bacterium]|jgi:DNA repair protein RecO (recombination protein O)